MSSGDDPKLPVMKITADWLEVLVVRGWAIRWHEGLHVIEFIQPDGVGGSEYKVRNFMEPFPRPVVAWLLNNVPQQAISVHCRV